MDWKDLLDGPDGLTCLIQFFVAASDSLPGEGEIDLAEGEGVAKMCRWGWNNKNWKWREIAVQNRSGTFWTGISNLLLFEVGKDSALALKANVLP